MSNFFASCSKLYEVDMSGLDNSIVTDMNRMFYSCSRLISLNLSGFNTASATDMSGMFASCVSLPSTLTSIPDQCFDNCGLECIVIPDGVTSLGDAAFYNCSSLTTIVIPVTVTTIGSESGSDAFEYCTSLRTVNYKGSETDKDNIIIYKNYIESATWNYNYTGN